MKRLQVDLESFKPILQCEQAASQYYAKIVKRMFLDVIFWCDPLRFCWLYFRINSWVVISLLFLLSLCPILHRKHNEVKESLQRQTFSQLFIHNRINAIKPSLELLCSWSHWLEKYCTNSYCDSDNVLPNTLTRSPNLLKISERNTSIVRYPWVQNFRESPNFSLT